MGLLCSYPARSPGSDHVEISEPQIDPVLQSEIHGNLEKDSSESSPCSSAVAGSPRSSPSSILSHTYSPHGYDGLSDAFMPSQAHILTPTESALLNHYLEHTSKDTTVDDEEQYILQTGIPNLAIKHKLLMKSVLAFSAVCKCCDIINQSSPSRADRNQILVLLSIADRYHMESLRGIQATLPGTKQYDHILANAAMMAMYGSSSHRIRIWLTETTSFDDPELARFVPKSCQWMSLFRAVRVAYTGLLNDSLRTEDMVQTAPDTPPIEPLASWDFPMQCRCKIASKGELQAGPQGHALYPILAATVVPALEKLRLRAGIVAGNEIQGGGYLDVPTADSGLQACFTALELFSEVVAETFSLENMIPSEYSNLANQPDIDPLGQVPKVSPWMQRYAANITSMVPSKLPRRFIMAFIHKAPTKYLNMVGDMMGLIQSSGSDHGVALNCINPMTTEPSLVQQLAVDIFAHFLVLVLLLDKVWWIGGIGAWELKQIVSLRKDVRWRMPLWETDEDWWPESMLEISRQFDKHRAKGFP
ncbi:uncharacterized protein N7515_010286 [Penicillium bovifimosum]|uniref:C6 transcription factor n=1 Tax=Penicillium bovifimosum TaxID=126998 RepID=A0A9W9GI92_9EURO|nr:uncharacterized protein N7515_010286 [Penicillium bovifimosum]KAJ5120898.1 hypothetical protein N7515_010286 [Penicillium bovifimosum]